MDRTSNVIEFFDSSATSWKRWLELFEIAMEIRGKTSDDRVPFLLHHLGASNYEKMRDFFDDESLKGISYADLTKKLKVLFQVKVIEIAECYKFQCRMQGVGESIKDYVTDLKKLSQTCGFKEFATTAVRNQFVFGLNNAAIRQRLLEIDVLTLEKALNTATSMELSKQENEELTKRSSEIHWVPEKRARNSNFNDRDKRSNFSSQRGRSKRGRGRGRGRGGRRGQKSEKPYFYRCGEDHYATECSIDRNVKCKSCNIKGHIQKVCFRNPKGKVNTAGAHVNVVSEMFDTQRVVQEMFVIEHPEMREKITTNLHVNGQNVTFDYDTGAAFTLMNEMQAKALFTSGIIYKTRLLAMSYTQTVIQVKGFIVGYVLYKNKKYELNLYLTDLERPPLLGREWMRLMKMWPFNSTYKTMDVNVVENVGRKADIEHLLKKYENLLKEDMSSAFIKLN